MKPAPLADVSGARFRRSTFCVGGSCVEVAALPGADIALRDSKDENSPVLRFTAEEWDAFLAGALDGQFSREALRSHAAER